MGMIRDRGMKYASYLRAAAQEHRIKYDYSSRGFEMPPGYSLSMTSNRNPRIAVDRAKALDGGTGIDGVVYAFDAHDLHDGIVMVPLRVYGELLRCHLEQNERLQRKEV
jgi:hypothetical protein